MVRANKVQVGCKVISLGKCRSPARGAESKSKGEKERREMQGEEEEDGKEQGRGAASKRPRTQ
jgi:hypothetical protein